MLLAEMEQQHVELLYGESAEGQAMKTFYLLSISVGCDKIRNFKYLEI